MSAPSSPIKTASRRSTKAKGNKLEPVMFTRGLKALCDDPAVQKTLLKNMRKVSSQANMKMHHVMRSVMRLLLRRSKQLLRNSKKEGLDVNTLHVAFRLLLPVDSKSIVTQAHEFAMKRVQQYNESIMNKEKKATAEASPAKMDEDEDEE